MDEALCVCVTGPGARGRVYVGSLGPRPRKKDKWVGDAPEDAELDVALGAMKNGKAAGCDEVTAEAIEYGGDELALAAQGHVGKSSEGRPGQGSGRMASAIETCAAGSSVEAEGMQ